MTHLDRTCIALALFFAGCCPAERPSTTFTVDDAQIARLTEGATTPTAAGCNRICGELDQGIDASGLDGAPPDSGPVGRTVSSCILRGHLLTCDWPPRCMPG